NHLMIQQPNLDANHTPWWPVQYSATFGAFEPSLFDGLSPEALALAQNLSRRRKPLEPPAPHRTLGGMDAAAGISGPPGPGGWNSYYAPDRPEGGRPGSERGGPAWDAPRSESGEMPQDGRGNDFDSGSGCGMRAPHLNGTDGQRNGQAFGIWNSAHGRQGQNAAALQMAAKAGSKAFSGAGSQEMVAARSATSSVSIANSALAFSQAAQVQAETILGAQALAQMEKRMLEQAQAQEMRNGGARQTAEMRAGLAALNEALVSDFAAVPLEQPLAKGQPRIVTLGAPVKAAKLVVNRRIRVRNGKRAQRVGKKNEKPAKAAAGRARLKAARARLKVIGKKSPARRAKSRAAKLRGGISRARQDAKPRAARPGLKSANVPIRAVLFDLDGVLSDSEALHRKTFNAVFARFGVRVPKSYWLTHYTGTGARFIIEDIIRKHHIREPLQKLMHERVDLFLREVEAGHLKAVPGAKRSVDWARDNGLKVMVASGGHRVHIKEQLGSIGLSDLPFVGLEDTPRQKPHPDIFLAAAARLGVKPGECLVIEDSAAGLKAARAAGMRCVLVGTHHPAGVRGKAAKWMKKMNAAALARWARSQMA
ncbi:MAG: HAD family phosphatase, partial [Candidatus Micrarchaeota archaeon]|nr:HAD family phosphatase [Candidatus Micrarchaeota archaeon]